MATEASVRAKDGAGIRAVVVAAAGVVELDFRAEAIRAVAAGIREEAAAAAEVIRVVAVEEGAAGIRTTNRIPILLTAVAGRTGVLAATTNLVPLNP